MFDFKGQNTLNSISAGATPQTPLEGAYGAPPYPLAACKGTYTFKRGGRGTGEEGRAGKEREKRGRSGAPFNFLPQGAADISK